MKFYISLLTIAAIFSMTQCKNGAAGGTGSSRNLADGLDLTIVESKGKKDSIKTGDKIYYVGTVYLNDSATGPAYAGSMVIPPYEVFQGKKPVVFDMISAIFEGDSAYIIQTFETDTVFQNQVPLKKGDKVKTAMRIIKRVGKDAVDEEKKTLFLTRESRIKTMGTMIDELKSAGTVSGMKTTASGIKYILHENGNAPVAKSGESVNVHYIGMTDNKEVFDDSFSRGQTFSTAVGKGQVIPGWDELLQLVPQGSSLTAVIPANLAYGAQGAGEKIAPNATLYFYMQIEKPVSGK